MNACGGLSGRDAPDLLSEWRALPEGREKRKAARALES